MNNIYSKTSKLGKEYGADKIILYGSRARGDNRERSDIDIAVFGMPKENQGRFAAEIEELPSLLKFDIAFISENTSRELLENIKKDGKIIMSKLQEKLNKFASAVQRLDEALNEYEQYEISAARDGVIQRFEICTELAWKSVREYLLEQGYSDINSPKSVMKTAYTDKLIDNEAAWLDILNARNLSSHLYDESAAKEIFENIKNNYIFLFKDLLNEINSSKN